MQLKFLVRSNSFKDLKRLLEELKDVTIVHFPRKDIKFVLPKNYGIKGCRGIGTYDRIEYNFWKKIITVDISKIGIIGNFIAEGLDIDLIEDNLKDQKS